MKPLIPTLVLTLSLGTVPFAEGASKPAPRPATRPVPAAKQPPSPYYTNGPLTGNVNANFAPKPIQGKPKPVSERLAPADPHPTRPTASFGKRPPSVPPTQVQAQPPIQVQAQPPVVQVYTGQPISPPRVISNPPRSSYIMPPLSQVLFNRGGVGPDGLVKGKYFAVEPDGSTGALLGSFETRATRMTMFPAGGDIINVLINDAPKGKTLATDYAHYGNPPIDRLEITNEPGNPVPQIGTRHENEPHDFFSKSSGSLNFFLGGPTLDASIQQKYTTISHVPNVTRLDVLPAMRIRFIPD
jgi:hypothetical protein